MISPVIHSSERNVNPGYSSHQTSYDEEQHLPVTSLTLV